MAGIAAVAVLEHLDVRHLADAGELRDLGGDVADHQRRIGRRRTSSPAPPSRGGCPASPAARNGGCRRRHPVHRPRLVAARLEQRGQADDRLLAAAAPERCRRARRTRSAAARAAGIGDRRAAFGMAAPLVMDEIAERPTPSAPSSRADATRPSRSSPSRSPPHDARSARYRPARAGRSASSRRHCRRRSPGRTRRACRLVAAVARRDAPAERQPWRAA